MFQTLITHCFYGCGHIEQDLTTTGSSDAMEGHYWDKHYDPAARSQVLTAGQAPARIGKP